MIDKASKMGDNLTDQIKLDASLSSKSIVRLRPVRCVDMTLAARQGLIVDSDHGAPAHVSPTPRLKTHHCVGDRLHKTIGH